MGPTKSGFQPNSKPPPRGGGVFTDIRFSSAEDAPAPFFSPRERLHERAYPAQG
jgi:hypothetical protein